MSTKQRYRIGEVAQLLGVSADTVRRWADGKRLRTRRTRGGQRLVDGTAVAEFLRRAAAGGEREPIVAQSARNTFDGIVTAVVKDRVVAQVEMRAGPHRIVSLMTREAADELGLAPGVRAVAAVKATNVVIEVPRGRGREVKEC
jgi:molybdopterin-binding protein